MASSDLFVNALLKDHRVATAKELLLAALQDGQKEICSVRPPNPNLKHSYDETIARFSKSRGGPLWFPYLGSGIGNGPLVELLDGSVKYDFISGIGVHFFGHSHPALLDASIDAALSDVAIQGHLQQNGDSVELSMLLTEASKLPHCFLSTSGAMATENALKIAFQKNFPAQRILAFNRCFAGRTLALAQITDKPLFREGLPPTLLVDYVPFFDPLRPEESSQETLRAIQKQISRYPKGHAAMVFELVQGEGGSYPGTSEFFIPIMQLLKENHIAVFVDEVQTFGRTPQLFAYQYFGLQDYIDICSIGKLSQVCATLFRDEYKPKPGLLSQTFTGGTASIRCTIAILKILLQGDFYGPGGRIARLHAFFVEKFLEIAKRHPGTVNGPFGLGGLVAFTPFDGDAEYTKKIVHALFDEGLLCFIAGSSPTRIRMLPPFAILKEADIIAATAIIEKILIQG
ncbi:MAG: aminotransferase class III-fold pyridoxal phosphate-dependent enzyme [Parachlamydiaceae bacterium]|nr:aminotransferase class III-fold pyridoxal phosphate-dependent enzyme [Parachlamydiaceae bacterium]